MNNTVNGQGLHQIIVGATEGDAITDQALLIRRWLRDMGFTSEIYAQYIDPSVEREILPVTRYQPQAGRWVIYHHSIGSAIGEQLQQWCLRVLMIYHNITPPKFFASIDAGLARQMQQGMAQLPMLRQITPLALADSAYNERDLQALNFPQTGVLPIVLDERNYRYDSNPQLVRQYQGGGPYLLFVGRLAPNKRQEDLIKLLYYYRKIEPAARLLLVGNFWTQIYQAWLRDFARELGLADAVIFTGHVSQQDMVTYYRLADIYVSLSEHEGFGKPLIESIYFDLPVVAFDAAAVSDTLGGAGVLVKQKNYEALAELVHLLLTEHDLRQRILARQRQRLHDFLEPMVRQRWQAIVSQLTPNFEPDASLEALKN